MNGTRPKPLEWVASSKDDLRSFPTQVQDHIGFALFQAQIGARHRDAKPLKGLASGVLEIVSRAEMGSFRTVYVVGFPKAVYVLHAFQKKSKRGIATPKTEIDLVRRRLLAAERHYAANYAER